MSLSTSDYSFLFFPFVPVFQKDEVYLNLVLDYVPETVYRVARHFNKAKTTIPIIYVKVGRKKTHTYSWVYSSVFSFHCFHHKTTGIKMFIHVQLWRKDISVYMKVKRAVIIEELNHVWSVQILLVMLNALCLQKLCL